MTQRYPKRLIEVDLPIKRISAHARREKYLGTITSLHLWWARRPLAACRAVICAALWPDPADELCPKQFRQVAEREMHAFAKAAVGSEKIAAICDDEAWERYGAFVNLNRPMDLKTVPLKEPDGTRKVGPLTDLEILRSLLLDFIADFAAWEASTNKVFLQTARNLTQAAHEGLGGPSGSKPLVVDPFAGGGSIPLEALRAGADAYGSDINPIPVLLNRIVLEYIPQYGQRLIDEVRTWGEWVGQEAQRELARFYPKDSNGATPIAYLWARTIKCEGPGCGAEIPLIRSLWLAKKANRPVALQLIPRPRAKCVDVQIVVKENGRWVDQKNPKTDLSNPKFDGTIKRGSATCPCCGFTMPVAHVREQLRQKHGGANEAKLLCIVTVSTDEKGRTFRCSTPRDNSLRDEAYADLRRHESVEHLDLSLIPDESTEGYETFVNRGPIYGMTRWLHYFNHRQALALATFSRYVSQVYSQLAATTDTGLATAVTTVLALAVSRATDHLNSGCSWNPSGEKMQHLFARQAIPMVWDFCEASPFGGSVGSWKSMYESTLVGIDAGRTTEVQGTAQQASATSHPLPDDSADALVTDPPYYYSVQYADLADFFYVWLRRLLRDRYPSLFAEPATPKTDEIIVQTPAHANASTGKNNAFYESKMRLAMRESRRILAPSGIGVVVFAHTSTRGWESLLSALIDAGWIVSGSWPIDTELATRVISQNRSVLASSVHIVCRPRENLDGSVRTNEIGDWRDVLAELPRRIHDWMPRLAEEGVVGADAIFACLGPALEVFSRYSRVEKASGEAVTLHEYLEQVWAAVAKEALTMIFTGADAAGFEEDARLTAMWLWTLRPANGDNRTTDDEAEEEQADEEESGTSKRKSAVGYTLEYDAARKIAQGLGAHLEKLTGVLEVQGDTARLLSVSERTRHLFGKDQADAPSGKRKKKDKQMKLAFEAELEAAEAESGGWGERSVSKTGDTVLDRLHQAMILFAAGRSEAVRRFLVDDGIGRDQRFWRLAQALSALYPSGTDEKRWVDGVLARKKGLGL